ncbi:hypothetical protein GCM10019016_098410 [Streptomyces prasinosporus]|uniref:Uncharacterized protein n=1 Tax=Streptomyces prasinosporus TaxID=68256 RepID=A0ABP6U4Y4_9ACTN
MLDFIQEVIDFFTGHDSDSVGLPTGGSASLPNVDLGPDAPPQGANSVIGGTASTSPSTEGVRSIASKALSDAYSIAQDPSPENIAAHQPSNATMAMLAGQAAEQSVGNSVREAETDLQTDKEHHQLMLDANEAQINAESVSKGAEKAVSDTRDAL